MPRARLLTRPFALCAVANLAQGTAYSLFLHFPGFLNGIGASDVEIGLLFGLTGFSAILARPPIGRAMDARGRRGVILLGNAIHVLAIALYLSVTQVGPALYGIRIAHGIAEAMLFTAFFTYAADCVPAARRTEGFALFGVSGMLPIALGGLLGDLVLRSAGYTALFSVACGFAVLSLLLSLPLRDLPRGGGEEERSRGFRAALTQRDLLPIWWVTFAFALAVAALFTFVKRYVDETGLASVGGFFSAYCGAAILLRLSLGWLPDRIGPKRVLFPSLGAVVVACCLLATATDAHQVIVAGTLFGLGHGFAFPVLFGILVKRAHAADRGSAMGIFTAFFDVGIAVGGPLVGALIMSAGFGAAFAATAGIVAVGMLVFGIWDKGR